MRFARAGVVRCTALTTPAAQSRMHIPFRSVATMLMAVGVATCSDATTGPGHSTTASPSGGGRASVAFQPVFSSAATAVAAHLGDFGISYDHVRIVLVRPVADTVKDTTITFGPGLPDVTLDLTVAANSPTEGFTGSIDYTSPAGVVFHGEGNFQAHAANRPAPTPQPILVNYVGPGATVARITISPGTPQLVAPVGTTFSILAFDANNGSLPLVPVTWAISDPSVATVTTTGHLQPTGKRGSVTITATTPNNVTDHTTATISLPAAGLNVVSGAGQSGKAGAMLASPAVVRAVASDSIGVGGVTVIFAAPVGGAVGTGSAVTDATGSASTTLTLAKTIGPQSFVAVAAGFSAAIPVSAVAADAASIAAVSGGGQSDTVHKTLGNSLVVKVADAFDNPVAGVTVSWSRTGDGALSAASATTGADGQASVAYTFGGVVGTETVVASVAGVLTNASFSEVALASDAAGVAAVSGTGQSVRAGEALANSLVVRVTDVNGNPVADAAITWVATNGTLGAATTTSNAAGISSNTLVAGTTLGNATVTASIAVGGSARFAETVTEGVVNKVGFKVGPTSGTVASAVTPSIQVAVQDAGGNTVPTSTASVTLEIGNNTGGAVLAGTLTRAAVAGVATFDDIKLDKAGNGYTLVARSTPLTSATSGAFNIGASSAATVTGLTFSFTPQSTATNNVVLGTAPAVQLVDSAAHPVALGNVVVTLTATTLTGGAPPMALLAGTSTAITATTDANGIATFTGVRAVGLVQDFTLKFSATPSAQPIALSSGAIHLAVGPAYGLKKTAGDNQIGLISDSLPSRARVQLVDTLDQVTTSSPAITIAFTTPTGGGYATTSLNTNGSGYADASWVLGSAEIANTLLAQATINGGARSVTFNATASDIHAMAPSSSLPTTATNGVVLSPQPSIQLNDGTTNHNALHKAGVVITATVAAAPGSTGAIRNDSATFTLSGTATATTNANGQATFTNLGILSTLGGLTGRLTFAASSLPSITADVVVNTGTATTMQRSTSLVVNTPVPTPLPSSSYPAVRVVDAGGSPVPNASGLSIVFSRVSGNCTASGTATTSDANGVAAIPSFTVPNLPAQSCQVRATSSLGGSPLDFYIVLGPAGGSVWLGATDTDFATASNWRGSAVPASGANMFIPKSVPYAPTVTVATTVNALSIEAGASFNVSGDALTVNGTTTGGVGSTFTVSGGAGAKVVFHGAATTLGNLNVAARTVQFDNSATITGNLVATDTATILHTGSGRVLTIGGLLTPSTGTTLSGLSTVKFTGSTFPAYGSATTAATPAVTQISGDMSVPSGVATTIARDLTVSDAALTVNGDGTILTVGGSLDITGNGATASGEVIMTSGTPTLVVKGTATFRGKTQQGQSLTAGTLDLRGDFAQQERTSGSNGEFEPGGLPFLVKFSGSSAQNVSFAGPGTSPGSGSYFANVTVTNQSGVNQSTDAYVNGGTMTVVGDPNDLGAPAMWATGLAGKNLFITGGGQLLVHQSGLFTVTSGGSLDLTGGSCLQYTGRIVGSVGSVVGGTCVVADDARTVGSTDYMFRARVVGFRR
jgi:adhesin/invasin